MTRAMQNRWYLKWKRKKNPYKEYSKAVKKLEMCDPKEGFVWASETGGKKADGGKTRWDLMQWDVQKAKAEILTKGSEKYAPNNWKKLPRWRIIGAIFRHLIAHLLGEKIDPEWGFLHLSHAGVELDFLTHMEMNDIDN